MAAAVEAAAELFSPLILLLTVAPDLGAEITATNKVVALGTNAAGTPRLPPAGVEGVRPEHRQLLVSESGIQAAGHDSMVPLALLSRPEP